MTDLLLIVDGHSLMYRGFHALPLLSSKGVYTNAIQGFMAMLLKVLEEKTPKYCIVAFDESGPTFRHELYDDYKAGRQPTPDELQVQFPLIKELLKNMGIGIASQKGYEADDLIGTFAKQGEKKGVQPLILTGDKDTLQLVTEKTHVMLTKRGITETLEFDPQTLHENYGVWPEQVVDWKGLMGDSSDNIPGIPGVGIKTATKLIEEYSSMDNVYANSHKIKGKLGENIRANKDKAYFSKKLSEIKNDLPLNLNLEEITLNKLQEGIPFLKTYELRQLERRLRSLLKTEYYSSINQIELFYDNKDNEYMSSLPKDIVWQNIESLEEVKKVCTKMIQNHKPIAIFFDKMFSFYQKNSSEAYNISFEYNLFEEGMLSEDVLNQFKPVLEKVPLILHDGKTFSHILQKYNISSPNILHWDSLIGAYLLNPQERSYKFEDLYPDIEKNAYGLFKIYLEQKKEIENQDMLELMATIELPLVQVLFAMEKRGFKVDVSVLESLGTQFDLEIENLTEEIYRAVNLRDFNINSPQQIGKVLFDHLKLPGGKKNKTGYVTSAQVLENLIGIHPVIELILSYRQLAKLKSTYIDGLLKLVDPDNRIHTTFEQSGTSTGRISSTEPNLQNIPIRTKLGREIRKAFVPKDGWVLVDADYSQIELRVLAHLSQDKAMMEAFTLGQDIHTRTASEVYSVPMEKITEQMRSSAKAVNFGIVYGISDFGLAKNIGISVKEASDFIKTYFTKYPGVKRYMDEAVSTGKTMGYTHTLFGRRRYLPELTSNNYNVRSFGERIAMNAPIQGSAADIIKKAMVHVEKTLIDKNMKSRLILQVHDELLLECPPEEVDLAKSLLKTIMEEIVILSVPLTVEVSHGNSWYDTK